MQIDYQRCYNTLNLERGADWESARHSYRRLVHEWHPDRHTATVADSQRAQAYFIELTSSFNIIRRYHRRYKRMPLLPVTNSKANNAQAEANPVFSNTDSLLNQAHKKERRQRAARRRDFKRSAIVMLGAGFCISVLFFLFSLDKQLTAQASDEAKRVLRNTTPSAFQRSSDEVNRAEAKGAFIAHDPAGGALGQDGGELFRQE